MFLIKSFNHKGLEIFFKSGSTVGIQATHSKKLNLLLAALNSATSINDLKTPPSWRLHELSGKLKNHWSLTVNGNWRVIFKFEDGHIYLVDYLDYH